jgi:hypothetical protein
MTIQEINTDFIKSHLRKGEIAIEAEKWKMPRDSAYKIIAGKWRNPDFLLALYKIALERANKIASFNAKATELNQTQP